MQGQDNQSGLSSLTFWQICVGLLNLKRSKEHTKTNTHRLGNNLMLKLKQHRSLFDLAIVVSSLIDLI
jgi:hypothetical protein